MYPAILTQAVYERHIADAKRLRAEAYRDVYAALRGRIEAIQKAIADAAHPANKTHKTVA